MNSISPRAAVGNQFLVRPNPDSWVPVPVHPSLYGAGAHSNPPPRSLSRLWFDQRAGLYPTTTPWMLENLGLNPYRPNLGRLGRMAAMGVDPRTSALISQGGSMAATAVPGILAAAHITGAMVPFVGPAILGVTLAVQALLNSGCGQSCVVTSNWANQAESELQKNITAYFGIPAPRPQSAKTAALANFDAIWSYLVAQCSQAQMGEAGQRCVSDRQSGACKWHADADSPYPGGPKAGECWNWFNGYRDPIASDPNVVPDSALMPETQTGGGTPIENGTTNTLFGGGGGVTDLVTKSNMPLILGGLLLVLALAGGKD